MGGWFGELSAARGGSGFGANPIGYAEINAWAALTGRDPLPFEVATLRAIDAAMLTALTPKTEKPRG